MKKTTEYVVRWLTTENNDIVFNNFKTFSRLEADMKVDECKANNYSGYLLEVKKVESEEFPQCNKTTEETIKIW